MPELAVVNASPLIVLSRAGHLHLLQLVAARVVVPAAVADEVTAHSDEAARAIGDQAGLERVADGPMSAVVVSWDLGAGESAVLSWAAGHPGCVAVIDDHAARTCADVLGVPVIGTLGLALRAKVRGRVSSARPLVEELRRAGLYLSDGLIREALSLVGE